MSKSQRVPGSERALALTEREGSTQRRSTDPTSPGPENRGSPEEVGGRKELGLLGAVSMTGDPAGKGEI